MKMTIPERAPKVGDAVHIYTRPVDQESRQYGAIAGPLAATVERLWNQRPEAVTVRLVATARVTLAVYDDTSLLEHSSTWRWPPA